MSDQKFITFKRPEMEKWMANNPSPGLPSPVPDAVVIRRQDKFAPPALDAYSNSILVAIEMFMDSGMGDQMNDKQEATLNRLQEIADYFHEAAVASWTSQRKLPD